MRTALQLFLIEYKYRYPKFIYAIMEILIEAFALWVIYQSSKVIIPNIEYFKDFSYSYFDFVFIAEMTLRIPSLLVQAPISALKFSRHYQIMALFVNSQKGYLSYLYDFTLSRIFKEMIKITLLFLIANLFYGFKVPTLFYLNLFLIQLLFSPFFLALGLLGAFIFIHTGRGEGVLMKGFSVLAIFSGLYFPITIFPELLQNVMAQLSPLKTVMALSRTLNDSLLHLSGLTISYFILGIVLLIVTHLLLKKVRIKKLYEFDFKN